MARRLGFGVWVFVIWSGCERLSGFEVKTWVEGDSSFGVGVGVLGEIGVRVCDGG